ncbi:MAG: response regulator [Rhodobacteraceae bacterium]|nr:response regulator [Paracoccaceae bacterium]
MARAHVLVVEDEPAQREILNYNLNAQGYRVSLASNGEEGMLMLAEDPPDLVVLDWMLPNLSGIEVCRQIKAGLGIRRVARRNLPGRSASVCGCDW